VEFTGERLVPDKLELLELHREHIMRYVFALPFSHNKSVLDAACGCGYGSFYLASKGAKQIVGIDTSEEAIAFATQNYAKDNLSFQIMNCSNLAFADRAFDVVCSFETIEHLEDPTSFLFESKRVLREGGVFIVSTPNIEVYESDNSFAGNMFHVREFTLEEFQSLLSGCFNRIEIYGQMSKVTPNLGYRVQAYILYLLLEQVEKVEVLTPFEENVIVAYDSKINSLFSPEILKINSNNLSEESCSFLQKILHRLKMIFPVYREVKAQQEIIGKLGEGVLALNHLLRVQSESLLRLNHNINSLNAAMQNRIRDFKLVLRGDRKSVV
jgi:2-polyprenyl-3-methyl-5-hydroxy-6-metoxy-1,4-benzoquinol methylase